MIYSWEQAELKEVNVTHLWKFKPSFSHIIFKHLSSWNYHFWLKNDSEKFLNKSNLKFEGAPSEVRLIQPFWQIFWHWAAATLKGLVKVTIEISWSGIAMNLAEKYRMHLGNNCLKWVMVSCKICKIKCISIFHIPVVI